MQESDIGPSSHGRVIRTPQGYWAYVPAPLPPPLALSPQALLLNSEADRALARLDGLASTLPNPRLLVGPLQRQEAVVSSRIEGTRAALQDVLLVEASEAGAPLPAGVPDDASEVRNYFAALEHGLKRLGRLPVGLRLIREVHKRLMRGVRGKEWRPGEFRKAQVLIGGPGVAADDAAYVPPPVGEMNKALDELESYMNNPLDFPPLVRLALIHYQFEAIHPFMDGNGRTGRLLLALLMCAEGLMDRPLLYLSAYFERHRAEYYDLLLAVTRKGAWAEWVHFFLRGVAEQSADAHTRAVKLLRLRKAWSDEFRQGRSSGLMLQLVDQLFVDPWLTAGTIGEMLDVTPRTAQHCIDKLVEAEILVEATGRKRDRAYIAPAIVDAAATPLARRSGRRRGAAGR